MNRFLNHSHTYELAWFAPRQPCYTVRPWRAAVIATPTPPGWPPQLDQAIADYRAGQSVARIGATLGRSGASVHRALRRAGVELRARKPIELPSLDLIRMDWGAGLSCRQIATKHRLPDHKSVARLLTEAGVDVHSRPARRKIPGVILGRKITDFQSRLRRRAPPMVIPARAPFERGRAWTAAEFAAIDYELRAGRYQVIPRGQAGLRRMRWSELAARWRAEHGLRAA